jgi:RNA polymerase sigma factor (sigma-70 family)
VRQSNHPDEDLAEHASRGDRRALAAIYKRYHRDLFRYCAALLGNPEDAGDALQNTMVKVLSALPGERRRIDLKPWLYRIAHNESVELLRRRRDLEPIEPEALLGAEGPEASAEIRERLRRLIADLRELPERQRGSLVMRELGDLSFEQIGSAFETTAAAARQTVYEARIGLQEMERGREMECREVRHKLSDGDRRVFRRRDLRAHLRGCPDCREFEREISRRRADLAAISPLPALAAAGLLKGVLGGAATGSAGGAAGGIGAGGGAVAAKAVATVVVAGAIGVSAADRAGLVQVFPGSGVAAGPAASGEPRSSGAGAGGVSQGAAAGGAGGAAPAGAGAAAGTSAKPATAKGNGAAGTATRRGASQGDGAAKPDRAGTASGGGAGSGHAYGKGAAKGKGAGSANAHGANPQASGGNPGKAVDHGHESDSSSNAYGQSQAKAPGDEARPPDEQEPEPEPKAPTGHSPAGQSGSAAEIEADEPSAHGKSQG